MKHFKDGDQLVITRDDFVNLQESPAHFVPLDSQLAKTILENGFGGLSVSDLSFIHAVLDAEGAPGD